MALHELGYRAWPSVRTPFWQRTYVVAATGVRRAWQSRWLRRMLIFAWLPAAWSAVGFFIWEQSLRYPELAQGLELFLHGKLQEFPGWREVGHIDPTSMRHSVWAYLLLSFFRYPQAVLMVIMIGLITPPLISQDIRSRAFLIYFSRPITRWEYLLGKFCTVWFFLATISTIPALALYVIGVLLSPQLSVLQATWDLPLRILAASVALSVPTAALALCFSSFTQESRYAGFAWFATWVLGWVTFGILTSVEFSQRPGIKAMSQWAHVSLYHILGRVQSWIFGFVEFAEARWSIAVLIGITVISTTLLARRVAAPMRV